MFRAQRPDEHVSPEDAGLVHEASHQGPDNEEQDLVSKCLAGDKQAWDQFFQAHYQVVVSIVRWKKWGFDRQEQDDVIQDVLEAIIKSLKGFEFKSRLRTFVHTVTVNTCITVIRKKTATKRAAAEGTVPISTTGSDKEDGEIQLCDRTCRNQEEHLLWREEVSLLKRALTALEERCKQLIRLRYFMEESFQEIAEKLGVKENTLVVQMKRCLLRLTQLMKRSEQNEDL